ncbi:hypothetical protein TGAM01_v201282 [Trichoderma gamsii]|uniref:NmrA-like domain-containing protein n=1 Tax=Trichoderma gamsii TaxID=398673 RepID=A0A2P5A056_9HYPO|nr:hypothetical protein TGAM01_v201282 [Trichoderma gamsii]PON29916.1 hypothetical protein TGAM01_v201282 [Trichoderma gamsii]
MASNMLVLGAGELGLAVLEALARHPKRSTNSRSITVALRQATLDSAAPDKKRLVQQLRALDVRFEAVDVVQASASELAAVFARYDTVISCTGMGLPSGTQTKLARAALEAGAEHQLRYLPWQFGMDYDAIGLGSSQDLFDEQLGVRALLRDQSSTEWLIVSTGLFMSFLFVPAFGVVDLASKTVRGLGSWDNRITLTTPEDIGRATAEVVLDPRGLVNQCVYVAGDTLSYAQVADLLDDRFGTHFRRELWDLDELARQMREQPDSVMVKYRDTFAQGTGVAWGQEKTLNRARGMDMTDVKAYLAAMDASVLDE